MKNYVIFFLGALAALAGCVTTLYYQRPAALPAGSASDNTFLEANTSIAYPGPQADTLVVATNTARSYLEISNTSTSSPGQALFCSTNDRPATLNAGFAIFASSTKVFNLDNMYRGAIHCKFPAASSSVLIFER